MIDFHCTNNNHEQNKPKKIMREKRCLTRVYKVVTQMTQQSQHKS